MQLLDTALRTIRDVLPIVAVLVVFQVLVLRRPILDLRRTVVGLVLVVLGLALFLGGLDRALFPLGKLMAEQLTAPAFVYGAAEAPSPPRSASRPPSPSRRCSPWR